MCIAAHRRSATCISTGTSRRSPRGSRRSARRTGPSTASSSSCRPRSSSARCCRGVVDLATEATGCHACFIYLLEDWQLTIRAASPVFARGGRRRAVLGRRGTDRAGSRATATPEFIRERAMDDPRMKYVPLLQEERFQSMVAVPILSRAGETIGVIVLHTEAPREFAEDTLKLLVHIASLVSGAIENAQLYDQERRRVGRADRPVGTRAAGRRGDRRRRARRRVVRRHATAARAPTSASCYRLDQTASRTAAARLAPGPLPQPPATLGRRPPAGRARRPRVGGRAARALWPELDVGDLLVTPLRPAASGSGCCAPASDAGGAFTDEDTEHRAGDRAPGGGRDQARGADRGADEREHRQGPVRGARRRARPRSPPPRRRRSAAT